MGACIATCTWRGAGELVFTTMMYKCAKFDKDIPSVKKLNLISQARLNFRRRPILCTTLYRNLTQASNFGDTFDQLFLSSVLRNFHRRCLSTSSVPWYKKVKNDQKLKSTGRGPALSVSLLENRTTVKTLWGHCQEYKVEKNAILQERLLSEKRSTFVHYNLTLSERICFADHEKHIQKFVAHRKVCQKSSQREVIRKNAYKAPKPQGV